VAYTRNEPEFTKWLLDNANTMGKYFEDPKAAPSPEFIRAYAKERQEMKPIKDK
jgi:hypothetical protein